MNTVIFNPLEEFIEKYQALHGENTKQFLEDLVKQSGVDIEQNRQTVKQYNELKENLIKMRRKFNWLRFLRVLMCITIILIPLVIMKTTPKVRQMREDINNADMRVEELLAEAHNQMQPLNSLFTDRDSLTLIEKTIPLISFEDCFSVKQEEDMIANYDFGGYDDVEQSTVSVLAGHYNENPFLFENKLIHTMGTATYEGFLTIYWTETYRDSNGNLRTRNRSETLRATVTKPKPYYSNQVILNYCAQGGPELCFSRTASHKEQLSERQIDKEIKKGEKTLKKMNDKAIKKDSEFMAMSNTKFEILFNALDRTNEVQFRTLFTPLAQTNMTDLVLSKLGYGDDFYFYKQCRTNRIVTEHSQGRPINLVAGNYISYNYDEIEASFINKNVDFFKAVYFDFAPLWAIPVYQERPVHSLKPIPDYSQLYSVKESEALANAMDYNYVVHPLTKTQAILKASYVSSKDNIDETRVTAYSYDIEKRIDYVPVRGGDGHIHDVPVEWDCYLPLEMQNTFYVASNEIAQDKSVIAQRDGLCIFN